MDNIFNIEDYIDKRSNEILSDEVWVWRLITALKEEKHDNVIEPILLSIVKKGGKLVDYSDNHFNANIFYSDKDIVDYIMNKYNQNPNYGSDGNGLWFE